MTTVELRWQVRGEAAADYAYSLFSALCRRLDPALHQDRGWSMSPVVIEEGEVRDDRLRVTAGTLAIRCNVELVPAFAGLYAPTGLAIRETGALMLSTAPTVHVLQPERTLAAERVTIKASGEGTAAVIRRRFEERVHRRLAAAEIEYSGVRVGAPFRIHVVDQWVHGYAVEVEGLSDESSTHLQAVGLGGRQRMGCGFMRRRS